MRENNENYLLEIKVQKRLNYKRKTAGEKLCCAYVNDRRVKMRFCF